MTMYVAVTAFTSSPVALLATTKDSVFLKIKTYVFE
jgi:hypothetical protein